MANNVDPCVVGCCVFIGGRPIRYRYVSSLLQFFMIRALRSSLHGIFHVVHCRSLTVVCAAGCVSSSLTSTISIVTTHVCSFCHSRLRVFVCVTDDCKSTVRCTTLHCSQYLAGTPVGCSAFSLHRRRVFVGCLKYSYY